MAINVLEIRVVEMVFCAPRLHITIKRPQLYEGMLRSRPVRFHSGCDDRSNWSITDLRTWKQLAKLRDTKINCLAGLNYRA
jgi:hypothetical protein